MQFNTISTVRDHRAESWKVSAASRRPHSLDDTVNPDRVTLNDGDATRQEEALCGCHCSDGDTDSQQPEPADDREDPQVQPSKSSRFPVSSTLMRGLGGQPSSLADKLRTAEKHTQAILVLSEVWGLDEQRRCSQRRGHEIQRVTTSYRQE